jgi:hypothetical protein
VHVQALFSFLTPLRSFLLFVSFGHRQLRGMPTDIAVAQASMTGEK